MNINKTFICGRLTRDVQLRQAAGKSVASFGLAVNHSYKSADGEKKEEVLFIDVEAWGRTGELAGQYLHKGSEAFVEGRLKLDTWEKDGQKQARIKLVAESVQFGAKASGEVAAPKSSPVSTADKDEVPF
jgi:single-strand DNA-binding protein